MSETREFVLENAHESGVASAVFQNGDRRLRLEFPNDNIVRVTFTGHAFFSTKPSRIVNAHRAPRHFDLEEDAISFRLTTPALTVVVNKATGALQYLDNSNNVLMREPERGGKWLKSRPVTYNMFDRDKNVEIDESIDGVRAASASYTTVFSRNAFEAKLEFTFHKDEALFGLGSHEEGYCNLRGCSRELYQQNMKAVVPHLVSTRGYGVLFDCCSAMTFHDDSLGSYWWADCVEELDFYVIAGGTHDGIIRGYHDLTGPTPLPPRWAFGFMQSKERYVTAGEMIQVVEEHRDRHIPLDVIVLDWKSWPNSNGWGQKSFDPVRFPNPSSWISQLHALGARLMVSIWPIMTGGCDNRRQLLDGDFMLGNKSTYDAFDPNARACYWEQANEGLFRHGVDAWWCDCTEPFEADWSGAIKPEPHMRFAINTEESKRYLDDAEINAYSLLHSQGMYEGQRRATTSKRFVNLTRSSYAGQHRYGTITWNGDICATWDALRRSIAEGLNFCATGEPYWTVDAGGFFIANDPRYWFWSGDYDPGTRGLTDMNALEPDPGDTGCTDKGFFELYTRWMQYATFLPVFRSHGTDASREIWRFGDEGSRFYDAIAETIRLRYRLIPYIYSVAAAITFESASMIRALALAFPEDVRTQIVADQFLFGPSLLICPVIEPMYFVRGSQPVDSDHRREIYLPSASSWYDMKTDHLWRGGQSVVVDAPLENIPVFVRAGSIIPTHPTGMQFADQVPDAPWVLHIYTGQDAHFTLYEDAGDGYAYERGECSRTHIHWHEENRELVLEERQGSFPELVIERKCEAVIHSRDQLASYEFTYLGKEHRLQTSSMQEPGSE